MSETGTNMVHHRQKKCFLIHFASAAANQAVLLSLVSQLAMDIPPSLPALVLFPSSSSSSLRVASLHRQKHGMEGEGGKGQVAMVLSEADRQTGVAERKEGRKEGSVNRVIYFPLGSILNKSGQLWSDVRSAKSRMDGISVRGLSAATL